MLKIFWVLCSYEGFRNITSVALRGRNKDLHFIDEEMETQKKTAQPHIPVDLVTSLTSGR